MADYWKSQDRKYCDFCKCWIADNKPSRDFHENGKSHKANVKKRLQSITKASAKNQRETEKIDATIKAMEAAAMVAYRRDVESNAATDLTSIAINKKLQEEHLAISGGTKKVWNETKTKDGKIYYWNIVTNETTWEKPKEGFLSLKEQIDENYKETAKQLKELDKYRQIETKMRMQEDRKEEEEERARLAREKLKERRVKTPSPEPVYGPIIEPGKNDPYGRWETVKQTEEVDLQLPEQEYYEIPVVVESEPVKKEFNEKTVESLGENYGESSFKKRKIPSGAKRNTRKRLDDD